MICLDKEFVNEVVIDGFDKYHLIARVLFSCFKLPTAITSLARSLARSLTSVITVGSLKHENNTLAIKLYLSNSSITTEQGVNTTSSVHLYLPLLNHPAQQAKQAGWGEAVPARMCHGKSRQLLNIFQLKKYLHRYIPRWQPHKKSFRILGQQRKISTNTVKL